MSRPRLTLRSKCRIHRGVPVPCYRCREKTRTLQIIGKDGSVTTKLRRLLVEEGFTSARRREAIFSACVNMERSIKPL